MKKLLIVLIVVLSFSLCNEKSKYKVLSSSTTPNVQNALWINDSTGIAYIIIDGSLKRIGNFITE